MPWRECKPVDEKLFFLSDCLQKKAAFSELCARYQISRKTGYKWLARYREAGLDGLDERSRARRAQEVIPAGVRQAIIELRRSQPKARLGPKKIQALLAVRFPDLTPPSRTSIYLILRAAGLVPPRHPRQRVPAHGSALLSTSEPNGLWSVDFKGNFRTEDAHWCYPLTVMDHASRFLIGCVGQRSVATATTKANFEALFRDYGLPDRIRSDNGVPFANHTSNGLSPLAIWWIRLGIRPERIATGKPQQNGRHERMHRTLKQVAANPPAANLVEQQRQLDAFRAFYNGQRPHEALKQTPPAHHYQASHRAFPNRLPELSYPSYMTCKRVSPNGVIYTGNRLLYVGYLLAGEAVGVEPVGDGVWDVYFGPLRLGRADERAAKAGRSTLKVSPM